MKDPQEIIREAEWKKQKSKELADKLTRELIKEGKVCPSGKHQKGSSECNCSV
jgi:hypothetical protein